MFYAGVSVPDTKSLSAEVYQHITAITINSVKQHFTDPSSFLLCWQNISPQKHEIRAFNGNVSLVKKEPTLIKTYFRIETRK